MEKKKENPELIDSPHSFRILLCFSVVAVCFRKRIVENVKQIST